MSGADKMWPIYCLVEVEEVDGRVRRPRVHFFVERYGKRSGCGGDAQKLLSAPNAFLSDVERLGCSSLDRESEGRLMLMV